MKKGLVWVGAVVVVALMALAVWGALYAEQHPGGPLEGYTRNSNYEYVLGLAGGVAGSSYTIPASLAEGTNLSTDTYISYEEFSRAVTCTPTEFLDGDPVVTEVVDDGVTYLVAHSAGAGAGNRYEETVYIFKDYSPCTAIRYYIHSTAVENYPEGTVREFDHAALTAQFDDIRRLLARSR
jgi:membrane-bound inhibitor of C-type lysozyme